MMGPANEVDDMAMIYFPNQKSQGHYTVLHLNDGSIGSVAYYASFISTGGVSYITEPLPTGKWVSIGATPQSGTTKDYIDIFIKREE